MKKQVITSILLVLLIILSGCGTETTGGVTKEICDDTCQQARDDYITEVNALLIRAQEITAKITEDWKTVTKQDLKEVISKKEQFSALTAPTNFEMVHDYYGRAFNHYVKAVDFAVEANEQYASASDPENIQSRNMLMSKVVNNIQEANKLLIYADEEVKFATRLVSKD